MLPMSPAGAFKAICVGLAALPLTSVTAAPSANVFTRKAAANGEFRNPLNAGADPTVVYFEGNYYLSSTQQDHIAVWKSPSLATLVTAEPEVVWRETNKTRDVELWAPAFHQFGEKWYIYYTAASSDVPDSERDSTHRLYVLESEGNDPAGPYDFKAQIADTGGYAIDGEPFIHDDQAYFTWSMPGRGLSGGPQQVYVAKMKNAWTIEGDIVALPGDGSCEEVREGPTPLYKDGKLFLTYSTCDTGKPDYSIWSISIDEGQDPLDTDAWEQVPGPLFSRNDDEGVWGPGHHFFFKSPDGKEDWIAYHGKNTDVYTYDFRSTRAQKIGWKSDGTPDLGTPKAVGYSHKLPSGDPGSGSTSIDDTQTTGDFRVEYEGNWNAGGNCGVNCFNGDDHFTNEKGATATYTFRGTQIAVYSSIGDDHGKATFTIDDEEPSEAVDYYDALRVGEQLVYLSKELSPGEHTLKITVLGEKREAAVAAYITVDRAEVYDNKKKTALSFSDKCFFDVGGEAGLLNVLAKMVKKKTSKGNRG